MSKGDHHTKRDGQTSWTRLLSGPCPVPYIRVELCMSPTASQDHFVGHESGRDRYNLSEVRSKVEDWEDLSLPNPNLLRLSFTAAMVNWYP
jgi:hypothetical protein